MAKQLAQVIGEHVKAAADGAARGSMEFDAAQAALARANRRVEYNTKRSGLLGQAASIAQKVADLDGEYADVR